jgi:hypothetical protein
MKVSGRQAAGHKQKVNFGCEFFFSCQIGYSVESHTELKLGSEKWRITTPVLTELTRSFFGVTLQELSTILCAQKSPTPIASQHKKTKACQKRKFVAVPQVVSKIIIVMSVHHLCQTQNCTWGSISNPSISPGPQMGVGMQLSRCVT